MGSKKYQGFLVTVSKDDSFSERKNMSITGYMNAAKICNYPSAISEGMLM
jgi:hypothetical protein